MLRVRIHMGCYDALHNRVSQIIASHKAFGFYLALRVDTALTWSLRGIGGWPSELGLYS
jgi:hypothetical protein